MIRRNNVDATQAAKMRQWADDIEQRANQTR